MIKKELQFQITPQVSLTGDLTIPDLSEALILFSHGSGSSRHSPRNQLVADIFNKNHFATLLTDLLTYEEDRNYRNRFNIDLLADRLLTITEKVKKIPEVKLLPIAYFGASTGVASALQASVKLPQMIKAIISRGGRPDLAGDAILQVNAPTLLIVGGFDPDIILLNQHAFMSLKCPKSLRIIEGAGHLFEEENKLEEVADASIEWILKYVVHHPQTASL